MLIFMHIPKCGGKSFRKSLKQAYGEDKVWLYYNNPIDKHEKLSFIPNPLIQRVRLLKQQVVEPRYDVVYGHFCLNDFSNELRKPNVKTGAFFRDPVEWLGSHLLYRKDKKHSGDPNFDFLKMMRARRLDYMYRMFLGRYEPQDLDFVGIVEDYQQSLELFEALFGKSLEENRVNQTGAKEKTYRELFAEQGILDEVEAFMQHNIVIYEQALQRFAALNELQKKTG